MKTPRILLAMPSGSGLVPFKVMQHLMGMDFSGFEVTVIGTIRSFIDIARNTMLEDMVEGGYDAIFFVDDDMLLPSDALRLMWELDKPVVNIPYKGRGGDGRWILFDKEFKSKQDFTKTCEVGGVGMGCTLIRREVAEELFKECHYPFNLMITLEGEKKRLSEDLAFCYMCLGHDIEMWAIHGPQVGHIGDPVVYFNK